MLGRLARKPASAPSARLEHERLTSLINSMADGVIAVDKHATIVLYNGAALNVLDRNEPMQGKSLGEVLHPVDKDDKPVDIVALVCAARTPTTSRDLRLHYTDGSIINLYLSIAPVRLGYGASGQQGYVVLLRDITREKSLEEERDEFISVASHELRTPIAITEGNISNAQFIVEKSGDMTKVKQALEEAHNQVLFLADLVNDLSTLSRAERGKLPVDIEPINVPELLEELAHNYTEQAKGKGLALRTKTGATQPLYSSKLYVREALQNFITNALKYTEHGSVTIAAEPAGGGVRFDISDTGIGISIGDQKRVFQKFFRSEDYRTRKTNGTGLGLYVTAKLAELLKAKIEMRSELNKGSTFSITVPSLSARAAKQ
ncbi:MAG TPA: ATP-binding protein [Candidatus Saccharimonadales bacterium]|nr:ATP-binding protein [Candidatus Saccharimonadales bacterium]